MYKNLAAMCLPLQLLEKALWPCDNIEWIYLGAVENSCVKAETVNKPYSYRTIYSKTNILNNVKSKLFC
jgi:hypothetical protein